MLPQRGDRRVVHLAALDLTGRQVGQWRRWWAFRQELMLGGAEIRVRSGPTVWSRGKWKLADHDGPVAQLSIDEIAGAWWIRRMTIESRRPSASVVLLGLFATYAIAIQRCFGPSVASVGS